MIDHAVILAAGMGTRIREDGSELPKPLRQVGGISLLKRTLMTVAGAGIRRATIVVGYARERVREAVTADGDYRTAGIAIDFVDNLDYRRSNGISVLAARPRVRGGFLLSMADHVYDPAIARLARGADLGAADLWLCVDRRIAEIYDPDDATKVRTEDDHIVEIGKTLEAYDCVDCGVFAVSAALFDALEEARAAGGGDCSLSDGVRILASRRRARVLPIGDAFWQDVDTPGARERAEIELARRA
jgi:choline kinase